MALTGLFLWSGEDPLPISEILSRLFFFFFWPFSHPSKSEARETKDTDLLICLSYILFSCVIIIPDDELGPGGGKCKLRRTGNLTSLS